MSEVVSNLAGAHIFVKDTGLPLICLRFFLACDAENIVQ
jgi:hypothetical protein